ncbi:MAG: cytochrome o ubiquinol oxidase subunit IV [Simkaniaceae bacterium]
MIDRKHGWNASFKPLFLGFTFSFILITTAYRLVTKLHLTDRALIFSLMSIAVVQAVLQLIFFLHLGMHKKNNWYLLTFLLTVLIIVIVVTGSIWIMYHIGIYGTST